MIDDRIQRDTRVAAEAPATATVAVMTAMLGVAAGSWVVTVRQMNGGMDMGVATPLGSLESFVALWAPMMAAMMLPGATPAVLRRLRSTGRLRTVPLFVGSYLAVWTLVGVGVHASYRPHGTHAAAAIAIAAGLFELSPLKRHWRRRCLEGVQSGWTFGFHCVGSCLALMLTAVAMGVMSVTWMSVVAVLVLAQKLLPVQAVVDVPLAVSIVALGVLIWVAPSSVPGLVPAM